MKMQLYIGVAALVLVAAGSYVFAIMPISPQHTQPDTAGADDQLRLMLAGQPLSAQVVRSPAERSRGLSGRSSLPDGQAMLFVFPASARHGIWMKDMRFPIDIVWLDESKTVVDIKRNATPDSYPHSFRPVEPARYVLELNAGFVERHNIVPGDHARW